MVLHIWQWIYFSGLVLIVSGASAQTGDYPNKPIRVITGSAGSNVDISSRIIARGISPALGQPVVVDNRSGAIVGAEVLAQAPADGYTAFITGGSFWLGPLMRDHTPYDPVKDVSPVTLVATAPAVLVVHPSLPVGSVAELIRLAKTRPGQLNYAGGGTGGAAHLAAELFKAMTGVDLVRVSYSSDSMQVADLLSGQVQLSFANTGVVPHIKSGRLRALGVTSPLPSPLYPGLPPIAATVHGYESLSSTAMFVRQGTPAAAVARLNREVVRVLAAADTKERFLAGGLEARGGTPEYLSSVMKSEMESMGKVIRSAGIRAD